MMQAAVCVKTPVLLCRNGLYHNLSRSDFGAPDRLENNGMLMRRTGGGGITMATGDAVTPGVPAHVINPVTSLTGVYMV